MTLHPPHGPLQVRAAIFSMIQSQSGNVSSLPEGSRWLDLFAGTGSVGLEAVSRGSEQVRVPWCAPLLAAGKRPGFMTQVSLPAHQAGACALVCSARGCRHASRLDGSGIRHCHRHRHHQHQDHCLEYPAHPPPLNLLNPLSQIQVHFVEMDPWVVRSVLGPNITTCGFNRQAVVHTNNAEAFLQKWVLACVCAVVRALD